ncbi:branched-chain amino acid ABC transporter substrate-binding protein [Photobacterium alginatilyticum]|uniref:Branched-chain amino acid ABC transporter substrate-binding protein n=2 Tax=Photobacterium alginatilyticum TaxID=1775171 RepID=A0ABW9YEP4_9GAMM|nr:substrate-binding protein [Photobacterium alginatilyticum]NBI52231.1 branched-chain amino acid ABC transporter substrate-binding protein [Photobacterium alginatilyticum]
MFRFTFFILWTAVLTLLVACSEPKPTIKIGVILPQTGSYQNYGIAGVQGAQLAVDQINAMGGVSGGHQLQLLIQDNQTDPAKSVRLARELIQVDDVFALMGPVSSTSREAVLEVANRYQVPLLYGIDYEGGSVNRYLFCYSTIPDHYVTPILPILKEEYGNNFYIVGYDYLWPHEMALTIEDTLRQIGGKLSGKSYTAFGEQNFTSIIKDIDASGADNLLLIMAGEDGFQFLEEMEQSGLNRKVSILAFAADETYLGRVSPQALSGVYTALHFVSDLETEVASNFRSQMTKRFADDAIITYATKAHYDLVMLLAEAIERQGVDREKVIDQMAGLSLYGGEHLVRLRDDHHFDLPMYLARFDNKSLQVVRQLGVIIPEDQRLVAARQ